MDSINPPAIPLMYPFRNPSSPEDNKPIDYSNLFFYDTPMKKKANLPRSFKPLLGEYPLNPLDWDKDRDFIIGRILSLGYRQGPSFRIWRADRPSVKTTIRGWVRDGVHRTGQRVHR